MQEFLNPKSMLTPGIAGSLMMFLVNGINYQFPEIPNRYLALCLSFVIGAVVWLSKKKGETLLNKAIYWALNSLVIFVVGFGTANLAADAAGAGSQTGTGRGRLLPSFSSALAQTIPSGGAQTSSDSVPGGPRLQEASPNVDSLKQQLAREREEKERLKEQLESMKKVRDSGSGGGKQFFKKW